jgi:hypothetical protein
MAATSRAVNTSTAANFHNRRGSAQFQHEPRDALMGNLRKFGVFRNPPRLK